MATKRHIGARDTQSATRHQHPVRRIARGVILGSLLSLAVAGQAFAAGPSDEPVDAVDPVSVTESRTLVFDEMQGVEWTLSPGDPDARGRGNRWGGHGRDDRDGGGSHTTLGIEWTY